MKVIDHTFCLGCNTSTALVVVDPRYDGLRGICIKCGGNWAES